MDEPRPEAKKEKQKVILRNRVPVLVTVGYLRHLSSVSTFIGFIWGFLIGMVAAFAIMLFSPSAQGAPDQETIDHVKRVATYYGVYYGINPRLIVAIIDVESSFNPNAIGKDLEIGLMQLKPTTVPNAPNDIVNNILLGTRYLAYVRARCEGRFGDAWFVCYNYGPYTKITNPKGTNYYRKVMASMERQRRGAL